MEKVQLLLRQHVGAPCAPCVAVGDKVKKGTLIATPTGLGANIFSSVYGEVSEILEDRIVIKADAEQPDEFVPIDVPEDASKLDMIKAAGIVGMGGAGFPTGIKLNIDLSATEQGEFREDINPELPKDFKLEHSYILINDSECEPGLAHNIKQTIEQTDKVIRGVKYCMEITKADKAIFAIKKKNREAVLKLLDALKDEENISVHLLPDIYPMGEERAVVRECLGVNLDTTQLPSAARSVVINLETVAKIAEAIEEKKPCISKNVTVRGNIKGGSEAHVFMDVPVGISHKYLADESRWQVDLIKMIQLVRSSWVVRSQDVQQSLMSLQLRQQVQFLQHIECLILQIRKLDFLSVHAAAMKLVCVQSLRRCMEKLFLYADVNRQSRTSRVHH